MVDDVEPEVLCKGEEFPGGGQFAAFFKPRKQEVEGEHEEVGGDDTQKPFEIEFPIRDVFLSGHFGEELAAYQKAAEDKEKVYSCPAEAADKAQPVRVAEDTIVIDKHEDDGQGPEVVQAGETIEGSAGLHR